jgi:hypothetical protein
VVIDFDPVPEAAGRETAGTRPSPARIAKKKGWPPEVLVRKLSLAAETSGTTVLLLTDASRPRALPWPVALRIELSRPNSRELGVRVAKDKRGRIGVVKKIPFRPLLQATG